MTREELINLAGSEEKAERAIDAILAGIKPSFALMAMKAAGISAKRNGGSDGGLHTYYIGYRMVDGTGSYILANARYEAEAHSTLKLVVGRNLRSIICTVDLGSAESFSNGEGLGLQ